jgi:hypothetical protein
MSFDTLFPIKEHGPVIAPDTLLTRQELSDAYRRHGIKLSVATLATYVSTGGGPPVRKFGFRPFYLWREAQDFAVARVSGPQQSAPASVARYNARVAARAAADKAKRAAAQSRSNTAALAA